MTKLAVNAICNGTVLDHLPAGQAFKIAKLLSLEKHPHTITIGLKLPSKSMGKKDIIKIKNGELSPEEANQITLFAPEATINIITNFEITKKFQVALPDTISSIFNCPNNKCITHFEPISTLFYLSQQKSGTELCCHYCCKTFAEDTLTL